MWQSRATSSDTSAAKAGLSQMSKPYPKPRPQSGTTLVVLDRGGFKTRPRSAFTVCEVDPSLAVRTSIAQLMTAILSQRACGTGAGLKPAPTSFATAMCFPSGVCGTLVICDCQQARPWVGPPPDRLASLRRSTSPFQGEEYPRCIATCLHQRFAWLGMHAGPASVLDQHLRGLR
jgi:hypothetical protein